MGVDNKIIDQSMSKEIVYAQKDEIPNEPPGKPTLQNIVSTVNLQCKLDLKRIALEARNTEYNPK